MIICIDYDLTYTRMPDLLDTIIKKSKDLGYRVILATMRHPHEVDDSFSKVMSKCDQTIFTCRKAKYYFLKDLGIKVDLWIDDNPIWLLNDSV